MNSYIDGDATLIEIASARVYHAFNGYEPWSAEENFVIMLIRPLGWGSRGAMYLFSLLFCCRALFHDINPIFLYGFSRERDARGELRDDSTDIFEWYVHLVYILWVLSVVAEALSYLVGRYAAIQPKASDACTAFPWVMFNRSPIRANAGVLLVLTMWFIGLAVAAAIALHTIVSHCYVKRNRSFLSLFAALLACAAASALADVLSIGGPNGIRAFSKGASWLASLRAVVIAPALCIFGFFFVLLCMPDLGDKLECVDCNQT